MHFITYYHHVLKRDNGYVGKEAAKLVVGKKGMIVEEVREGCATKSGRRGINQKERRERKVWQQGICTINI